VAHELCWNFFQSYEESLVDKYEKRVVDRLHDTGAQLVRTRGHRKWRLFNGKVFIQPTTPSDWRNFRKQDSTLKRLLEPPSSQSAPKEVPAAPLNEAEPHRVRTRLANNPPHEESDVEFFSLPSSPVKARKPSWQFQDVNDVLTAVDSVPAYWELDCCGRVRVLMKLASRFAKKVEVLTAFAVLALDNELNLNPPSPYITDHSERAKRERDWALKMRTYREWEGTAGAGERWCQRMKGLPCLLVHDLRVGEILIETSASGLLLGVEETMAFSGLSFAYNNAQASLPQWSNYEESMRDNPEAFPYPFPDKGHLSYLFVDRVGMSRSKITYRTCENWLNPTITRKVVQSIYESCSMSEDFAETEISL
jgi:hypothetical protein